MVFIALGIVMQTEETLTGEKFLVKFVLYIMAHKTDSNLIIKQSHI